MLNGTEQLVATHRALLDTAHHVGLIAIDSAARLFELNVQAVRASVTDATEQIKSLLDADPSRLATRGLSLAQPGAERIVSYTKQAYEIVSSANGEIAELLQRQVEGAQDLAVEAIDSAAKSAPAGSETVFAAARSSFGVARSAYEQALSASRRLSHLAEQNLAATGKINGRSVKKAATAAA